MSDERIAAVSLEEAIRSKGEGRTELGRVRRKAEKGIEPDIDSGEGEFDGSKARKVKPPSKTGIFIRLDDDILAFFRSHGRGYQARINAVLRGYLEAQSTEGSGPAAAGQSGRD